LSAQIQFFSAENFLTNCINLVLKKIFFKKTTFNYLTSTL
jgi:hypothetical protein